MAIANCSTCNGEINTESSPTGKCVRCRAAEVSGVGTAGQAASPDGKTAKAVVRKAPGA